jgi:hypothetical protein
VRRPGRRILGAAGFGHGLKIERRRALGLAGRLDGDPLGGLVLPVFLALVLPGAFVLVLGLDVGPGPRVQARAQRVEPLLPLALRAVLAPFVHPIAHATLRSRESSPACGRARGIGSPAGVRADSNPHGAALRMLPVTLPFSFFAVLQGREMLS